MISNPVQMIRDDDNNDDEKIRANSPTPRPVSRWGWMDPLCPAQNQSQSPVGDAHDEKWWTMMDFNLRVSWLPIFSIFPVSTCIPLVPEMNKLHENEFCHFCIASKNQRLTAEIPKIAKYVAYSISGTIPSPLMDGLL